MTHISVESIVSSVAETGNDIYNAIKDVSMATVVEQLSTGRKTMSLLFFMLWRVWLWVRFASMGKELGKVGRPDSRDDYEVL